VHEGALDLRPGELAILVPLVGILLFLSAWPAAISDRATARAAPGQATAFVKQDCVPPGPGATLGMYPLCAGEK